MCRTSWAFDILGLVDTTVIGPSARDAGGVARRMQNLIEGFTGVSGILTEDLKVAGSLDRQLEDLYVQKERQEDYLEGYEEILRRQFTTMEVMLGEFQSISTLLANRLNAEGTFNNDEN